MTIRVLSFEFDGCLFNRNFIENFLDKDVIKYNKDFLDDIKHNNRLCNKVYTFVGSNRQSKFVDDYYFYKGVYIIGSCFPAVNLVNRYLGATLDPFLLADIYCFLPDGTSYNRAVDRKYSDTHAYYEFDETKATIMYAQMHKIANQHPNEVIVYDFYDSCDKTLNSLVAFYNKHKDLIPNKVTFCLHQYEGAEVTLWSTIKGEGFIDSNYRETVRDMYTQAMVKRNCFSRTISVVDFLNPELLKNRKKYYDLRSLIALGVLGVGGSYCALVLAEVITGAAAISYTLATAGLAIAALLILAELVQQLNTEPNNRCLPEYFTKIK